MKKADFKIDRTRFENVYVIQPFKSEDSRGSLMKGYSYEFFYNNDIDFRPVETLLIESDRNVLRGLHFQRKRPIKKLLSCIQGELFTVVVDINKESRSFGKYLSFVLTSGKQLYVGADYALGTYAMSKSLFLCENSEKLYPEYDAGIQWKDLSLDIRWPYYATDEKPILSSKDKQLPNLEEYLKSVF